MDSCFPFSIYCAAKSVFKSLPHDFADLYCTSNKNLVAKSLAVTVFALTVSIIVLPLERKSKLIKQLSSLHLLTG